MMNCGLSAICFFFFIFLPNAHHAKEIVVQKTLMWQPQSVSVPKNYIYSSDVNQAIHVDGASQQPTKLLINHILPTVPSITFACKVIPLTSDNAILKAEFCWKRNSQEPFCHEIRGTNRMTFYEYSFLPTMDPLRGAVITSDFPLKIFKTYKRSDLSGEYWCDFRNKNGRLLSSLLQIHDLLMPFKEMMQTDNQQMTIIQHSKSITSADLPLTLDCPNAHVPQFTNTDMEQNSPRHFQWCLCQKSTAADCLKSAEDCLNLNTIFDHHYIYANGSVTIYSIKGILKHEGKVLLCRHAVQRHRFFGIHAFSGSDENNLKTLTFDGTVPYSGPLVPISPTSQTIEVGFGKRTSDFFLMAIYRSDYRRTRPFWYKNGKIIMRPTTDVIYKCSFGTEIKLSDEGNYRLEVDYNGRKSTFEFNLRVTTPPLLDIATPFKYTEYVMEGASFSTSMIFKRSTNLALSLNGYDAVSERDTVVGSVLKNLNYKVEPSLLDRHSPLTYTAINVTKEMSHVITFEARNDYGTTRLSKLLRVVPKLRLSFAPSNYNCVDTSCNHTLAHEFYCKLDPNYRDEIKASGVTVSLSWYLEKEEITPSQNDAVYLSYFNLSNHDDGLLKLEPVPIREDTNIVFKKLKDTYLVCVVILSANETDSIGATEKVVYDSRQDEEMTSLLTAKLKLYNGRDDSIAVASMYWLWAIIVAIMLTFMVCVLLMYAILRQRVGATYYVDEEERAQGNDPEKEVKEKEVFHTYERMDEDVGKPLQASQPSLKDSVGVHSNSDSDFDAVYDLEPSKFNEDGSFIYKYGNSDPRSTRRPEAPQVVFSHSQGTNNGTLRTPLVSSSHQ